MKRIIVTTAVLALMSPMAAHAGSSWTPVARWEMNEKADQTVLRDSSGNGLAGTIGKQVTPTKQRYHSFPRVDQDTVRPQHLDVVPDNPALDPGTADFAVVVKFTWDGGNDRNLIQKGQGSPAGGMFKMKTSVPQEGQPAGYIKCLFRGATRDSQVESYAAPRLDDGKWHVVRCESTSAGTAMYVDGALVDTNDNLPGSISNDWPVAIGGNTYCDDTATQNNVCNYWFGRIGFVRWLTQ